MELPKTQIMLDGDRRAADGIAKDTDKRTQGHSAARQRIRQDRNGTEWKRKSLEAKNTVHETEKRKHETPTNGIDTDRDLGAEAEMRERPHNKKAMMNTWPKVQRLETNEAMQGACSLNA